MSLQNIRIRHEREFVTVANAMAQDPRLSLRARGLFLFLYSLPDGWDTSTLAVSRMVPEGRDAVRTAARELEACGYLIRRKLQVERGRWITEWLLGDRPVTSEAVEPVHDPVDNSPKTDFQASVDQASVDQASRERTQRKKDNPPTPAARGRCAAHPNGDGQSCRRCGTNPRALQRASRHPDAGTQCPEHVIPRDDNGNCRSCRADRLVARSSGQP